MLIALAVTAYVAKTEGETTSVLFTLAVISTVAALVTLVSRRLLFAISIVAAMVGLLCTIAYLKQQTTDVTLHAYDAISLLTSWTALGDLWQSQTQSVVAVLVALIATTVLGYATYKLDGSRVKRRHALVAAALFASIVWVAADSREARRHMGFYYEYRHLWFFFSSWVETAEALWRGHLLDAAAHRIGPKLIVPASCTPASKPPHIVLIHQESVVPPSHFPSLSYDRGVDPFFHSHDGKLHKLRVETFGGASWLTEFSVLTGLSAFSLGNLRQFAQTIMAGKVRETLPQALSRCGYRNVAFHPMLRIYLSIGNFLEAVGVHQVFDSKARERSRPPSVIASTTRTHSPRWSGISRRRPNRSSPSSRPWPPTVPIATPICPRSSSQVVAPAPTP